MLRIGVKKLPGGAFSEGVVDTLHVGDELDVMTPSGRFTTVLDPSSAKTYVAIAAGSGITPVISIVATILESEPGAQVMLVYANRTHRTVMFLDELHDLKDRFPDRFQLVHVLCPRAAGRRAPLRTSRRRPADPDPRSRCDRSRTSTSGSCAGPSRWSSTCVSCFSTTGSTPTTSTPSCSTPTPCRTHRRGRPGRPTRREPRTSRSGSTVVPPTSSCARDGVGVLEAALEVRSDLPFACRGGVCGTCRAKLVEGTVAMDVNYALEPEEIEDGYVLTCQSHPTSDTVVVDYDA